MIRHLVFHGRVQGVGFRAFVADEAARIGIDGWVRNCSDGTVEAVFSGAAAAVETAVAVCRKGCHGSRVDSLDVSEANDEALALRGRDRFAVLPTV